MRYPDDPDEPVWEGLVNDPREGASWEDWYCERPPEGAQYEVIREESDGYRLGNPVRAIFEVRVTGGTVAGEVVPG